MISLQLRADLLQCLQEEPLIKIAEYPLCSQSLRQKSRLKLIQRATRTSNISPNCLQLLVCRLRPEF